jgi:hypothetical protein
MNHEWVENNSEFEAVLVCTNELGAWDQAAAVRAFQIFQWDDASTPGNDSSFVHVASGVVVRYGGNVLAIECGHGHLAEALADLSLALNSIGWRSAELYHPQNTIDEVLADIGRAIPANMDFEVKAAGPQSVTAEHPETAAMAKRAREMFALDDPDDANSILLREFQSLGESPQMVADSELPVSPLASGAVVLLDDDDDDSYANAELDDSLPASGSNLSRPAVGSFVNEVMDEQPQLFELPVGPVSGPMSERAQDNAERGQSTVEMNADDVQIAPQAVVSEVTPMTSAVPATVSLQPPLSQLANRVMPPAGNDQYLEMESVVTVGQSTLCFSLPGKPVDRSTLQRLAEDAGIPLDEIIYVTPGSLHNEAHWDVLHESDPEKPFSATLLASLIFPGADETIAAATLLAAQYSHQNAHLRDVLAIACLTESEFSRRLSAALPTASPLLVRAGANGDLTLALNVIVRAIGAMFLVKEGCAFIDTRAGDVAIESTQTFTIRELLSRRASVFFVDAERLDSSFLLHMVSVMYRIATHHAHLSTRTDMLSTIRGDLSNQAEIAKAELDELAAARAAEQQREEERKSRILRQLEQMRSSMNNLVDQLVNGDEAVLTSASEGER